MGFSEKTERLFEEWKRAVRENPNAPQILGTAANRHGQIHWKDSVRPGTQGIPSNPETVQVDWGLEPLRKRTPAQRVDHVAGWLYDEALRSYQATGKVSFPRSVIRDIQMEFWRNGQPIAEADIERLAADQIRPLAEKYAAALLARCENKYEGNRALRPVVGAVG